MVACGKRKKRRSFIEDGSNDLAYDISPDMVEDDLMSSSKDLGQVTGGTRDFQLMIKVFEIKFRNERRSPALVLDDHNLSLHNFLLHRVSTKSNQKRSEM